MKQKPDPRVRPRMKRTPILGAFLVIVTGCVVLQNLSPAAQPTVHAHIRGLAWAAVRQAAREPELARFYGARRWAPAWDDHSAQALETALEAAPNHGLNPGAFVEPVRSASSLWELELARTRSALSYARALSAGAADPTKSAQIFTLARNEVDVRSDLQCALDQHDVGGWLARLPPDDPQYAALSKAYLRLTANVERSHAIDAKPAEARALALAMERRRWLARQAPSRRIDVNVATATMEYYRDGRRAWSTKVVVGSADRPTPALQASFNQLVVNPAWRVPQSIAKREILPLGQRYMRSRGMRLTGGVITQPPGPDSALGLVKFDLRDPYAIYLHDTASKRGFSSSDRHKSHGCVRVQHAVAFARALAAEDSRQGAFDTALASGRTAAVTLKRPVAVRLLYERVAVRRDGTVEIEPDVYGRDRLLAQAMGPALG